MRGSSGFGELDGRKTTRMGFGTIFFIVVTVIVLYQLRSVLGRRTGSERPPFDPYTRQENRQDGAAPPPPGNVVTLPNRRVSRTDEAPRNAYASIDALSEAGTPLNTELRRIRDADPQFEVGEFVDGAKVAYEMIVTAFADGDRALLTNLLSPEVYQGFEAAIAGREERGERMQSSFVGIDEAKLVSAELKGREAFVTVRIVSQLISAVVTASGEVVDGDPETVVEVRDVWTFSRDTGSRDPNWRLVETESEDA